MEEMKASSTIKSLAVMIGFACVASASETFSTTEEDGGVFPVHAKIVSGQTVHDSIVPGSVQFIAGDHVWTDDGTGILVFTNPSSPGPNCSGSGKILYPSGAWSLVISPSMAESVPITIRYSHYVDAGINEPATRISVSVTNIVLHYVTSSIQSGAVTPPMESGIVNVVTEVGSVHALAISSDWAKQYPGFKDRYGDDFGAAIVAQNGKRDGAGNPMFVWQDYVAGTDPTDAESVFRASITFDRETGNPVVSWTPELTPEEAVKRTYTVFGKVHLNDSDWTVVNGNAASYNFFKVRVEMKHP